MPRGPDATRLEPDCSGLPGRTSLRHHGPKCQEFTLLVDCSGLPGRTSLRHAQPLTLSRSRSDCSGLPGRTSLRLNQHHLVAVDLQLFRPSRPDFIETVDFAEDHGLYPELFRPSRPDFIETLKMRLILEVTADCSGLPGRTSLRQPVRHRRQGGMLGIVPAFQAGLH